MKDETKDQKPESEEPIEAELVEIARHPGAPVTVTDLAALADKGQQIIQFRIAILKTLRIESIRMTNPEDWLLFRADVNGVEVITGYLQDSGCARIMPLWGIDVVITSQGDSGSGYSREVEGEDFSYSIEGYGVSKITQAKTERQTGVRYSYEDFCKDIQFKLKKAQYVKLAARANLDGHIVREITGLERAPLAELDEAWKGTSKSSVRCARGRGFGSKYERKGADASTAQNPEVPLEMEPTCPTCEKEGKKDVRLRFIPGGTNKATNKPYNAGWACSVKHDPSIWIPHAKVLKDIEAKKKTATPAAAPVAAPAATAPAKPEEERGPAGEDFTA